jgi:exo-beta-1,3-glucanase (GH17 family)/cellulose synthase/poly-beta-1,6-N-acetylglucosamine synthase-like glycosyltransferase
VGRWRSWAWATLLATLVAALNFGLWAMNNRPRDLPGWKARVEGVAYSAFQRDQSPIEGRFPSTEEIEADIQLLSRFALRLRTYASNESPQIPGLAQRYGMKMTAGAWIDSRRDNNQVEINALVRAAREHSNIDGAIVGNEVLHRGDLPVKELILLLDQSRKRLQIPVSTAEPWHQWLRYPELAEHVDYITVHLLPYWESVPANRALQHAMHGLDAVQNAFPDKRIVIGEIGWPSQGDRVEDASATPTAQARFIREFLPIAAQRKLHYYIMEAIDQPWKEAIEGRVGAYWGMFDAWRQPKFALSGSFVADPQWWQKALFASVLALLPMVWFARRFGRFDLKARLLYLGLIQGGVTLAVWLVCVPFEYYLDTADWAMQALLLPALLAIIAILLIAGFELVEVIGQRRWQRRFELIEPPAGAVLPKISIHLPCHNEPPDMVMLTLDSLARLDYPDFEVLVIDNNTADESVWKPVQEHCIKLGIRFRFFHLRPWPGFKAGALNFALEQTDPAATVIAVVDSDYEVERNWLRSLISHFDDTQVAVVQCPQAHREFAGNAFRRICNFEYDGFFRIGMHHRNERDAIIQHGTMTMIRSAALRRVGGWAQWCICEDAELGLKLMEAGYETRYIDQVMGRGLTPADFAAYKSQRFRWAFGAMQILRAHASKLLGRRPSALSRGQRFHFLTGWFGWFADALHLLFSLLAVVWTIGMLINRDIFTLPLMQFLVPVLGFTLLKAGFGIVLYRARVPCSWSDTLGAAMASMGLSHAIARGVLKGLVTKDHPFERTAKQRRLRKRPNPFAAVREEMLMLLMLIACGFGVTVVLDITQPETQLWCAILMAQSLPYLSAVITAWVAVRSGEALRQPEAADQVVLERSADSQIDRA